MVVLSTNPVLGQDRNGDVLRVRIPFGPLMTNIAQTIRAPHGLWEVGGLNPSIGPNFTESKHEVYDSKDEAHHGA